METPLTSLEPGTAPLELRLFGRMELKVNGAAAPPARTRKEMWLLAQLALRNGAPIERRRLAGILWPDSTDELALYNLRRSLWNLRSLLGAAAPRLVSPTSQTVALDVTGCFVDVIAFDAAASETNSTAIDKAISLYRAPLLEECGEEWVFAERESRAVRVLELLERLGGESFRREDFGAAERYWRRALSLDPLRESAMRALLMALKGGGDLASAAQAYREFRYLLRSELNVDPAPETIDIYRNLRETPHSPSVYEVRQSVPIHADEGNLPARLSPIIGREAEIVAIRRSLLSNRMVTLSGPGGVGKTRLALALAAEMQPELSQGAWLVDLSSLSDPSQLRGFIAQHLQVRTNEAEDGWQSLLRSLETASSLLVLDNCEHLALESADALTEIAARCRSVYLLATSRHRLEIEGGQVIPIAPLAIPKCHRISNRDSSHPLADELLEVESVKLFVERARQSVPEFALTEDNAKAVGEMCERMDGIPLAIELVAARVRGMTVQEIASRLDGMIDRLSSRDRARRQESLRAVMDWSWELLSEQERALLRRLGVFSGGCSLGAAEQVCAGSGIEREEVSDLLLQLIDRSLVRLEQVAGEGRYTLLDTVQRYARDMLADSGELDEARTRHGDYFLTLAAQAQRNLSGPKEPYWLNRIDLEYDNIRAALQSAADDTFLQSLSGAMWRYWYFRGYLAEGKHWLERALGATDGSPTSRSTALLGAAVMNWKLGEYGAAHTRFEEALAHFRQLGDRSGIAMAVNTQGLAMSEQGETDGAQARFEESLEIYRDLAIEAGMGFALENLGALAISENKLDRAHELLQESLRLFQSAGCGQLSGTVFRHLAQIEVTRKDFAAAARLLEKSVEIHERFGHRENLALAALRLGAVRVAMDDPTAARRDLEAGLARILEIGSRRGIATSLTAFAHLAACEQDWTRAASLFGAADALRQELRFPLAASWTEEQDRRLNQARSAISEPEFERARADGRTLSDKQAIELALQTSVRPAGS